MKNEVTQPEHQLFTDIQYLIEATRQAISQTVNASLTMLYWKIGKRIKEEVLKKQRAEYGKKILPTVSAKLVEEYGNGYSERNLKRMVDFVDRFP